MGCSFWWAASSHTLTGTTLNYAVTLEPKQIYEATVTVKNEGTFDANLTGLTLAGLSSDQAKYIHYSVFYNGTEYIRTIIIFIIILFTRRCSRFTSNWCRINFNKFINIYTSIIIAS